MSRVPNAAQCIAEGIAAIFVKLLRLAANFRTPGSHMPEGNVRGGTGILRSICIRCRARNKVAEKIWE